MIRRTLLNASAVFALGAASLGASAQTMVLKAADVHPAGYPNVVAVESMGKKLEAVTNVASKSRPSQVVCWVAKRK